MERPDLVAAYTRLPPKDCWNILPAAMRSKLRAEVDRKVRAEGWPQVQSFVERHGGVEYAYECARGYGEKGKQALADLPAGTQRDLLTTAVEYVINRLN